MSDQFLRLRSAHQKVLCGFIKADLGTGFAFVELAKSHRDQGARQHAKERAIRVVETIRRFVDSVEEPEARRQFMKRLTELEEAISAL